MPFYPTAGRDDGYDITDFFGVDPRLGTSGDFVELVRTARDRGIRVIVDFVVNHTSDQHPWFQQRAPQRATTRTGDFYVWRRDEAAVEQGRGRLPRQGGQHLGARREDRRVLPAPLLHNPARPQRRQPAGAGADRQHPGLLARSSGSSGFRVDAVPFLFADATPTPGRRARRVQPAGLPQGRARLRDPTRRATPSSWARSTCPTRSRRSSSAARDGDGLNMQFDFIGMQRLYLSLARGDAGPLAAALRERPALDVTSQWANFVRNHDELTLDKLTRPASARRSSPRSGPTPTCSSTAAACAGACRPCSAATSAASGSSTP